MNARNIGNEMIEGMSEAVDYMQGKATKSREHQIIIPKNINVRDIRKKLALTRTAFAKKFGFSPRTIQHWEQGDRTPRGPARILLLLLQRNPKVVEQILKAAA